MREDTGERVVAMTARRLRRVRHSARRAPFPIPDGVDDGTALALLLQGLTAWHLYRTSPGLRLGESVVVHAAAGGVGSLAVQLGQPLGAGRVIATASTEDKRALALELGADAAIDADPEGMTERLLEANDGRRVDVVLEMAGGAVFDASLDALAPFGGSSPTGSPRRSERGRTGQLMQRSRSVVGFWFSTACAGRRWCASRCATCSRAPRAASCASSSARRTRSPRRRARRATCRSAGRPESCCSTRRRGAPTR